jgi:hypothetical protein
MNSLCLELDSDWGYCPLVELVRGNGSDDRDELVKVKNLFQLSNSSAGNPRQKDREGAIIRERGPSANGFRPRNKAYGLGKHLKKE